MSAPGPLVDRWVDVHAHFYPPEPAEVRQRRLAALREGDWHWPGEPPSWSVEETLGYMDRTGIQMQLLSNVPKTLAALRDSNDYGASVVADRPDRFGLLAALPTDDPEAALAEIERSDAFGADGFAVTCRYGDAYLSDLRLEAVWAELDRRRAVVFAHPDAYQPGVMGRPSALIEVAFETARTVVDMLYRGVFRRYPGIRFVLAHCGGALPALTGRLLLLGPKSWVPNPEGLGAGDIRGQLRDLFLDTAATMPSALAAALEMTTPDHVVYGSDCGVPCTTGATMDANIAALQGFRGLDRDAIEAIGHNAVNLLPSVAKRLVGADR